MIDRTKVEQGVRLILEGIGEDPDRAGLLETPTRVARMYEEIRIGTRFPMVQQDPVILLEIGWRLVGNHL